MASVSTREQRLYGAVHGGAELLEIPTAIGTASRSIDHVRHGVYEGLRTFDGTKYFGLKSHIERLRDSIAGFKRELAYDEGALVDALDFVARDASSAFGMEARVRVDVAAEPATDFGSESNILLAVTPFPGLPAEIEENGAYLRSAPGLSRPDPAVKTSDFIPLREAWIEAHGDGEAYEYAMLDGNGAVLEGTQSNVVLVKDGRLLSAPSGILPGVTLRVVLMLAREAGIEVEETFTPLAEVAGVDEVFMTTSVRSVVPVSRFDEWTFPACGPITAKLRELYADFSAKDAVPAHEFASARY